jgi:DsbC/DsbD-like thiol-disulfide interchange protein
MRVSILLAIASSLLAAPAFAGESAWQELAPGVSVRLISAGALDAEGKALFALEIDMPEDTRTYWRVPGETGLPLELDFAGSNGVSLNDQFWPFPEREQISGYLDYVYFGHTVLPLELDVTDPAGMVALEATLGICSDICVPAQARLSLPATDLGSDRANDLRIKQALANVPIPWDQGDEPIGEAHLLPDGSALAVQVDHAVIDPDSLIAAADPDGPLFGAPQKSPQDDIVLLPILGKTDNSALDDMEVELSFMTPMGAYQVSRTLEAGTQADVEALD